MAHGTGVIEERGERGSDRRRANDQLMRECLPSPPFLPARSVCQSVSLSVSLPPVLYDLLLLPVGALLVGVEEACMQCGEGGGNGVRNYCMTR
jgi:hypothetical protein